MNDYERSIIAIKQYDCKLAVKEWNIIAKKYNYLSTNSLRRLSNKNFSKLNDEIRKS